MEWVLHCWGPIFMTRCAQVVPGQKSVSGVCSSAPAPHCNNQHTCSGHTKANWVGLTKHLLLIPYQKVSQALLHNQGPSQHPTQQWCLARNCPSCQFQSECQTSTLPKCLPTCPKHPRGLVHTSTCWVSGGHHFPQARCPQTMLNMVNNHNNTFCVLPLLQGTPGPGAPTSKEPTTQQPSSNRWTPPAPPPSLPNQGPLLNKG
jgi:hypothetical protein